MMALPLGSQTRNEIVAPAGVAGVRTKTVGDPAAPLKLTASELVPAKARVVEAATPAIGAPLDDHDCVPFSKWYFELSAEVGGATVSVRTSAPASTPVPPVPASLGPDPDPERGTLPARKIAPALVFMKS